MVSLGQALPSHLTPLSPISHHSAQATMGSGDLFGRASLPYASEPQLMAASMPQFSLLHLYLVNFYFFFMLQLQCYFSGEAFSCGLNVCVPPKLICLSHNPQCDGSRRWSLWGLIRFRGAQDSRGLMMGLVPL